MAAGHQHGSQSFSLSSQFLLASWWRMEFCSEIYEKQPFCCWGFFKVFSSQACISFGAVLFSSQENMWVFIFKNDTFLWAMLKTSNKMMPELFRLYTGIISYSSAQKMKYVLLRFFLYSSLDTSHSEGNSSAQYWSPVDSSSTSPRAVCCSEHLCSPICLLDHKCKRREVCFHFSATKNKSNLVTDSNWWRVKATSVKMFHFIAASLQRCLRDVAQTLHMSPVCPCQADSALTSVGKMVEVFFMFVFFLPTFFLWLHQLKCHRSAASSCCTALTSTGSPAAAAAAQVMLWCFLSPVPAS